MKLLEFVRAIIRLKMSAYDCFIAAYKWKHGTDAWIEPDYEEYEKYGTIPTYVVEFLEDKKKAP